VGGIVGGAVGGLAGSKLGSAAKGAVGARSGVVSRPSATGETGPCNSFTPSTKVVLADGSARRIDQVKPGDLVLATDPVTDTTKSEQVAGIVVGKGAKHLVKITVDTDGEAGKHTASVTATDLHPFWSENLRAWKYAKDLRPGTSLRTSADKVVKVTAVKEWTARRETVHNLTVAELHTYYVLVGSTPVLVHNTCDRGPDGRFQSDPNLVSDARYERVTLRSSTKQAIEDAAPKNANGDFIDPNTGKAVPASGPFHYGHKPGFEYWRSRDSAAAKGLTREQFIEYENDPTHYQIEDPYNNLSHKYEQP
jgi:hypothetical protein